MRHYQRFLSYEAARYSKHSRYDWTNASPDAVSGLIVETLDGKITSAENDADYTADDLQDADDEGMTPGVVLPVTLRLVNVLRVITVMTLNYNIGGNADDLNV